VTRRALGALGPFGALAAAAGGVALGLWGEDRAMGRERARADRAADDDFSPLPDARHREVEVSDGGCLHVVERGEGRPVVFLHGVTLSAVAWHYQFVDLAARFRVIAVDHRGHGRSQAGTDGHTIKRLGDDIAELLAALDLRDAILVGHSMGGMAILQFALDHPELVEERVAGSVLVATLASTEGSVPAWHTISTALAPVTAFGLRCAGRLPGGYLPSTDVSYLVARASLGQRPSPTHVELTRAMTAATSVDVLAELWVEIARFDVRDALDGLRLPALVVVGSRDVITPLSNARDIVRRLPGAELKVLPGAGHMLMLGRRHELNELIEKFAASV
jgi:pimeloyl-ACP methyl ester carboxylesterase